MSKATRAAWVAAGAAAGAVAATWLGKRRLHAVSNEGGESPQHDSLELPIGHSADPEIDYALTGDVESRDASDEGSLDEVWSSMPGPAAGEPSEHHDAVTPEDLGAVWLERATQAADENLPHANDPRDIPAIESLGIGEASLASSRALGDTDEEVVAHEFDDEDDIAEDALDVNDDAEK